MATTWPLETTPNSRILEVTNPYSSFANGDSVKFVHIDGVENGIDGLVIGGFVIPKQPLFPSFPSSLQVLSEIGNVTTDTDNNGILIISPTKWEYQIDDGKLELAPVKNDIPLTINSIGTSAIKDGEGNIITPARRLELVQIGNDANGPRIGGGIVTVANNVDTNRLFVVGDDSKVDLKGLSNINDLQIFDSGHVTFNQALIENMALNNSSIAEFNSNTVLDNITIVGGSKLIFREDGGVVCLGVVPGASVLTEVNIYPGKVLTVNSGNYGGSITGDGSIRKESDGTLVLSGPNRFTGGTTINGGFLEVHNNRSLGLGSVAINESGTLTVGDKANGNSANIYIQGNWEGKKGTLELVADPQMGEVGWIELNGGKVSGTTYVKIVGESKALNILGGKIVPKGDIGIYLILASNLDGIENEKVFTLVNDKNQPIDHFETSRYAFNYGFDPNADNTSIGGNKSKAAIWYLGIEAQPVTVPDLSTQVLMNIIAFEIPRAQNVDGPWAKVKGGEMNDNKAFFDHNSYQTVQVGWDKTLATVDGGAWNGGVFFEGDWAYGRGNWSSKWGTINGRLKSEESGIGAGLYLSKSFKNGVYFDTIGRINVFENEVNMIQTDGVIDSANNYNGKWSSSFFNLAFELGKDFTSKDGTWTFNPYERVIYTAAPQRTFNVVFGDDSIVNVRNNTVDAWTNKLGARLAYHNKQHRKTSSIVFVGADYYRGLSGRLTTETLDRLNVTEVKNNTWHQITSRRSRNDLNYGTATLGYTVLPKDNIAITAQGDVLYGEVDGWSVGLSGRVSF